MEWAHAIAPAAGILLVETGDASVSSMQLGVDSVRTVSGVVAVSMSWGNTESSGESLNDGDFMTPAGHVGITFVAATGDDGSPGGYPAYSPNVLAVGGTHLNLNGDNYASETAWFHSGGGQSADEPEPNYQFGVQGSGQRDTPDVAFDADPATGVAVYDSYNGGTTNPWYQVGGTSVRRRAGPA